MMPRRQILLEIALIFLVFLLQGAWPVPDTNEPTYLGKAIHVWNPDWAAGDFFLATADTHWVFYRTFGWLSLWLSPTALAWTGRVLTYALLAWAWRRLSLAVVPRRWLSVLTAVFLVFLNQHFSMAGEWIVGGVEAKGFAYVLVLLGLEALVRDRWNRTWLLLGAASAFHVLVGGWSAIAVGLSWLAGRLRRTGFQPVEPERQVGNLSYNQVENLSHMWPGLLGGFLLALPGLLPALALNWGVDRETVQAANINYVYDRLPHHLNPWRFPPHLVIPFVLLCVAWFALWRPAGAVPSWRRLRGFVTASVAIGLTGLVLSLLRLVDDALGASVMRFYWFRLEDVAVPLGVSLVGVGWGLGWSRSPADLSPPSSLLSPHSSPPRLRVVLVWTALVLLAAFHLADCAVLRLF
jgi:hypothetical protein